MVFNFKICLFSKVENNSLVVTNFPLCPHEIGNELKFRIIFILFLEDDMACFRIVLSEFLHKMFQIYEKNRSFVLKNKAYLKLT